MLWSCHQSGYTRVKYSLHEFLTLQQVTQVAKIHRSAIIKLITILIDVLQYFYKHFTLVATTTIWWYDQITTLAAMMGTSSLFKSQSNVFGHLYLPNWCFCYNIYRKYNVYLSFGTNYMMFHEWFQKYWRIFSASKREDTTSSTASKKRRLW